MGSLLANSSVPEIGGRASGIGGWAGTGAFCRLSLTGSDSKRGNWTTNSGSPLKLARFSACPGSAIFPCFDVESLKRSTTPNPQATAAVSSVTTRFSAMRGVRRGGSEPAIPWHTFEAIGGTTGLIGRLTVLGQNLTVSFNSSRQTSFLQGKSA
jgi:hypothetical protein